MTEENPTTDKAATRYASRKFILAVIAMLAVILLYACGPLSEDGFVSSLLWILGLYSGANVAQAATMRLGTKPAA